METPLEEKLFHSEFADSEHVEHLLEQYKLYVNSHEKVSDRRQKTNEFFLGLNTGLIALLSFVVGRSDSSRTTLLVALAFIAGIIVCYYWYRIILSYKGLNTAKFSVIHVIESRLPLALYDTEWEALGRGTDREKYWPFSHIESKIPWVFIILYVLVLIALLLHLG